MAQGVASGQPRRACAASALALWSVVALCFGACATAPAAKPAPADHERALLELRAKGAGYVRQIEELENRIFILEDQLDSRKLAAEQKAPAILPAHTERAGTRATARSLAGEAKASATASTNSGASSARSRTGGPAPGTRTGASTGTEDSIAAPGETSIVAEHSVDYTGDAVESAASTTTSLRGSGAPAEATRPLLRLSSMGERRERPSRPAVATAAPEPGGGRTGAPGAPSLPPDPLPTYRQALEILRAGQPEQALPRFRRFLEEYPQHDYADNAQYWIGECHYAQKEYRPAERAFRNVVEHYPRGNKVPDAMLKLGFTLQAMGDEAQGHAVLESLTRAFPKHEAARLASERLAHPEPGPAAAIGQAKGATLGTIVPVQVPRANGEAR